MGQIYFLLGLFLLLFAGAIGLLVKTYRRDRARERARVRDLLSAELRAELGAETEAWQARHDHFAAALARAEAQLPPDNP